MSGLFVRKRAGANIASSIVATVVVANIATRLRAVCLSSQFIPIVPTQVGPCSTCSRPVSRPFVIPLQHAPCCTAIAPLPRGGLYYNQLIGNCSGKPVWGGGNEPKSPPPPPPSKLNVVLYILCTKRAKTCRDTIFPLLYI